MQHWHPGNPRWQRNGRDVRYPPGWWVWPLLFIGLFLWAGGFLLIDGLIR